MSDKPQNGVSGPQIVGNWDIPDPTQKSLFSIRYHKLIVKRINALLKLIAVPSKSNGPLIISDGNAQLPVAGTASSAPAPGGSGNMNYKGTYSNSSTYKFGDVVRVLSGPNQGVYVCVSVSPVTGVAPQFPEPIATGGTNTWDTFSIGITQYSGCAGGATHTFYVNMLET